MASIHAVAGETFDGLAMKVYGSEQYAANILAANPALCHKMRMEGGEVVNLPEIAPDENDALPPWKRTA